MSVLTIIQARMGSTRLPGKVMMDVGGKPMVQWVVKAAPTPWVVAVPIEDRDSPLAETIRRLSETGEGNGIYFGSAEDVLERFYGCVNCDQYFPKAERHNPTWILRLTADCPVLTREMVEHFLGAHAVMLRTVPERLDGLVDETDAQDTLAHTIFTNRPYDPDGYDMELFSVKALEMAHKYATDPYDREHVTAWMYRHLNVMRGSVLGRPVGPENPQEKVSVDTLKDLEKARRLMKGRL